MKRIFFVCVEGFAKAKMDGGGFSLRLKTATENLSCFKFWNTDFYNLSNFWNFNFGEIFIIFAFVIEIVLVLELVIGTRMITDFLWDWKLRLNTYLASSFWNADFNNLGNLWNFNWGAFFDKLIKCIKTFSYSCLSRCYNLDFDTSNAYRLCFFRFILLDG